MLTSNCMYRPYIDTNNRQGMKLCRTDPIVEVMHSEFSGPSLPSIQRRVLCEQFGTKRVKILKFWRTELLYAPNKIRGEKMRLLRMDTCPSLNDIISSLFPYFNLFVSIFIQSYVDIKLHVSTLYRY
jgi:hypothetical protein